MNKLFELIGEIGALSLNEIWLPVGIWTLVAGAVLLFLNLRKSIAPLYQYHLRIVTLVALPGGILLSQLFVLAYKSLSTQESVPALISLSNPIVRYDNLSAAYSSQSLSMGIEFWIGLATTTFAILSFIMLIRLTAGLQKLNQIRRSMSLITVQKLKVLSSENAKAADSIGKEIFISFSDSYPSPFTFGLNKPIIVLPEHLYDNNEALNLVIGHELIHIRRWDYPLNLIVSFVSALFAFHPLLAYLRRQIEDFREISCDQEVITEFSASPKVYAELIFSFTQNRDHRQQLLLSLSQNNSNLKKRISTMKHHALYKTSYRKSVAFILILSVSIMLPIACTEMSSEVDQNEQNVVTMPSSPLNVLKLNDEQAANSKYYLDGKAITYQEFSSELDPSNIGSIEVINENGQRIIKIRSKSIQTKPPSDQPDMDTFTVVEQMPELVGGLGSLQNMVKYPELAKRAGIEGRVIVTFIVDEEGNVINPQVVRGIGGGCDEEALRVVSQAKFTPGMQRGKKVKVKYSLPVIFRLN
jgi:TonB family protein